MSKHKIIGWTTWGGVRGLGPIRATSDEAAKDLRDDQAGCAKQRGYSDRAVYQIDDEGYVVGGHANVYPHGRTHRALKVETHIRWHVSIKTEPHQRWTSPAGWGPYYDRGNAEATLAKASAAWMAARLDETIELADLPHTKGYAAEFPGSTNMSLCPIDIGFDLRRHGMTATIPATTCSVAYDRDGERRVIRGSIDVIVETLTAAGYTVRLGGS